MVPQPDEAKPAKRKRRPRKPNRFVRHWQTVTEIRRDPGSIPGRVRALLLEMWISRGGGFYGIGYVVAFAYFELQVISGEVTGSNSVGDFVLGQTLEYVLRLGFMSFVSALQALLWPAFVAGWWNGGGLLLLIGGYLAFEYLLKPWVEAVFPELREHRLERERRRAEKIERRAAKHAAKKEKRAERRRRRSGGSDGKVN